MRRVMLISLFLCSSSLFAADVTVNFKANLLATTCTINIVVGSSKAVNQTIDFGVLTWAEIEAQGSNTRKDFSLEYSDCYITKSGTKTSQTLNWMQTLPKASSSWSGYPTEMKGGTVGVAGVLYRTSNLNTPLPLGVNNTEKIVWSSTERSNGKLPLSLFLRPTSYPGPPTTSGMYSATLTFTTTYQ
ncbi:fimbrial protein [Citrobacter sp. RHBSTW-00671]|uniref:fimbrial protein n=1 Tax=Citrobacter sp. RHBSTW-00671 TaxID=2742660 RepID=UPI0017E4E0B2|nr:fimbrial protein [Citrobacter sp. RHBSTW-00671]MBA7967399.1 type 1 fimbrial protein [Citrobacter sp. RHBSTW-00671]HCJ6372772.1 type 1 fimbrial protein [Citrobacter freundii]